MKTAKIDHKHNLKVAKKLFKDVDFEALAAAIKTVFSVCSESNGSTCLEIARVACEVLKKQGVKDAKVVAGGTAWRVDGKACGAVISHLTSPLNTTTVHGQEGFKYHAWVKLNPYWCVDFSTFSLKEKMDQLDKADGQTTPVSWNPDFLLFNYEQTRSFEEVAQSYESGVAHYKENKKLSEQINQLSRRDIQDITANTDTVMSVLAVIDSGATPKVMGPFGAMRVA